MRKSFNPQLQFGQVPIEDIRIDIKSRDDIPQLLLGLQHIYIKKNIFSQVLDILGDHVSPDKDHGNGMKDKDHEYKLQTLKDNVQLLTPELLQTSTKKHNCNA